jgi:hypothetical protein
MLTHFDILELLECELEQMVWGEFLQVDLGTRPKRCSSEWGREKGDRWGRVCHK